MVKGKMIVAVGTLLMAGAAARAGAVLPDITVTELINGGTGPVTLTVGQSALVEIFGEVTSGGAPDNGISTYDIAAQFLNTDNVSDPVGFTPGTVTLSPNIDTTPGLSGTGTAGPQGITDIFASIDAGKTDAGVGSAELLASYHITATGLGHFTVAVGADTVPFGFDFTVQNGLALGLYPKPVEVDVVQRGAKVPEAATVLMLGLAVVGLGVRGRRTIGS